MKALGVLAAIVAALYGLYLYAYPSVTIRYRLALTVVADGAEHTGSGVIEVTYGKRVPFLSNYSGGIVIDVKGEAVAVDIPGRGTLFALLRAGASSRSSPEWIVPRAFGFPGGSVGPPPENSFARLRALTGRVDLSSADLPLLVRFRDINDPKTVERVDPNNLTPSFGSGVYVRQATLEITRDPVTTGIEKTLNWLPSRKGQHGYLHGPVSSKSPLVPNLNGYEFSTELFH